MTKNSLRFLKILYCALALWLISPLAWGEKGILMVGQYAWSPAEDASPEPYEEFERHEVISTIWGPNHTRRDIETGKIAAIIPYLSPEDFPTLTVDSTSLVSAINGLETSLRKFPKSRKWLEPKIIDLRKEAELYRLGSRKFDGRWHSPEEIAADLAKALQKETEEKRQAAERMQRQKEMERQVAEEMQRQTREALEHAHAEMERRRIETENQRKIEITETPALAPTTTHTEPIQVPSSPIERGLDLDHYSSHNTEKVMISLTVLGFIALAVVSIRNSNINKPKIKSQPKSAAPPPPQRPTSNAPPPPKRPTSATNPPPPQKRSTQAKDSTPRKNKTHDAKQRHSPPSATPLAKDERYYGRVLGLSGKITPTDIKRCYRELVVKYHPDKVQHLGDEFRDMAEQKAKQINEAYLFFRQLYGF